MASSAAVRVPRVVEVAAPARRVPRPARRVPAPVRPTRAAEPPPIGGTRRVPAPGRCDESRRAAIEIRIGEVRRSIAGDALLSVSFPPSRRAPVSAAAAPLGSVRAVRTRAVRSRRGRIVARGAEDAFARALVRELALGQRLGSSSTAIVLAAAAAADAPRATITTRAATSPAATSAPRVTAASSRHHHLLPRTSAGGGVGGVPGRGARRGRARRVSLSRGDVDETDDGGRDGVHARGFLDEGDVRAVLRDARAGEETVVGRHLVRDEAVERASLEGSRGGGSVAREPRHLLVHPEHGHARRAALAESVDEHGVDARARDGVRLRIAEGGAPDVRGSPGATSVSRAESRPGWRVASRVAHAERAHTAGDRRSIILPRARHRH